MEKKILFILFGIFFLSLLIRTINLNSLPFSLHTDELFAGYVGRYIFLHGQDIYGNNLPFYIDKFGDFRPIGIFLLSGLSTFIFGVNEFAIRFPSALIGALTVFPMFFVTRLLFKQNSMALLSSLLIALLPWHIILSRTTSEAVVGNFILLISIYFMLLFAKNGKLKYILGSLIAGFTTYLFYHSFRIILPILILPLFLIANKGKTKTIALVVLMVVILITLGTILTKQGSGRLNQVAFYNNTVPLNTIEFLKAGEGNNNILTARIFHNKIVVYGRDFINQYLSYFSPSFLFNNKGLPTRYVSPEQGPLFYLFIPLLIAALALFLSYPNKDKNAWIIFYILAIAVIPAAFTYEDSPNLSRASMMIPPLVILGSFGAIALYSKVKIFKLKKLLIVAFCILISLEFIYFWHMYSIHERTFYPVYRNEGNKALVNFVIENKNKYKHIYMPSADDLPVYYLFYTHNFDILEKDQIRKIKFGGQLHTINFINNLCINSLIKTKELSVPSDSLVIIDGNCQDFGFKTEVIIKRSDGTNAYKAFEVK